MAVLLSPKDKYAFPLLLYAPASSGSNLIALVKSDMAVLYSPKSLYAIPLLLYAEA